MKHFKIHGNIISWRRTKFINKLTHFLIESRVENCFRSRLSTFNILNNYSHILSPTLSFPLAAKIKFPLWIERKLMWSNGEKMFCVCLRRLLGKKLHLEQNFSTHKRRQHMKKTPTKIITNNFPFSPPPHPSDSSVNIVIYCTVNHNSACKDLHHHSDVCFWSLSQALLGFSGIFSPHKREKIPLSLTKWERNDIAILKIIIEMIAVIRGKKWDEISPDCNLKTFSCLSSPLTLWLLVN